MRVVDPISLRVFISTIEEGSIARAAKRENLVPSAISKRIVDLERLLGVQLLTRGTDGVFPTPAGEALARRSWALLKEMEDIHLDMVEYAQGTRGHVRVQASVAALGMNATHDLREFFQKERQITVDLIEQYTPVIIDDIRNGKADIGIAMDICNTEGLTTFPYRSTSLSVVVPVSHPLAHKEQLTYAETLDYEQIESASHSGIAQFLDYAAGHLHAKKRVKMRVGSYETICRMIASGLGLGIVPSFFKQTCELPLDLRFITLNEIWAQIQVSIMIKENGRLNSASQALLDFLRARAR